MNKIREISTIPVGISSCLAGQPVRFNGGHSRSTLCRNTLTSFFDFRPFCPEVEAGFGTPRPAMRLTGKFDAPRLTLSKHPETDLTETLQRGINTALPHFAELDGYLLMKNSPSCGLTRVKVYRENGYPHPIRTSGLFTRSLQQAYPQLPIEEEARLNDHRLLENFILRVYTHHRFRKGVLEQPSKKNLLAFHSQHKYLIMAHHQPTYRSLGKLLSDTQNQSISELIDAYFPALMQALSLPANRKNHSNVLYHLSGYIKRRLNSATRQYIALVIQQYREGLIPLIAPMTLLQHYIQQFGSEYVQQQCYFSPYPDALGLRNAI